MPRDIDQKKTRKALRKLRKAVERAEAEGVELTDWEKEFAEGVDERLNKYGSAFADLTKGEADEALSMAQSEILRQLDKKSRGKTSGGFTTRKPLRARKPVFRNRKQDEPEEAENTDEQADFVHRDAEHIVPKREIPKGPPQLKIASDQGKQSLNETERSPPKRPQFKVISGGKSD
ncbi:MAG: hypothetical protein CMK07_02945 [Ponticaulis sp.]|nr:hypothetical protein [Ponticaulis sp.]